MIKLTFSNGVQAECCTLQQVKELLAYSQRPPSNQDDGRSQRERPPPNQDEGRSQRQRPPSNRGDKTYIYDRLYGPLFDKYVSPTNQLPYDAPFMKDRPRGLTHAQWCMIRMNELPRGQIEEIVLSHNGKVIPEWTYSVPIILNVDYRTKERAKLYGAIWMPGYGYWILGPMMSLKDVPPEFRPNDLSPYAPFRVHFSMGIKLDPTFKFYLNSKEAVNLVDDESEEGAAPSAGPEQEAERAGGNNGHEEGPEEVAAGTAEDPPQPSGDNGDEEGPEEEEAGTPQLRASDGAEEEEATGGAEANVDNGGQEDKLEDGNKEESKEEAAKEKPKEDEASDMSEYEFPPDEAMIEEGNKVDSLFNKCSQKELKELDEKSKALLRHVCDERCRKERRASPAATTTPVTPFAAAKGNGGEEPQDTSDSSVGSPRIEARRRNNESESNQPMKTAEDSDEDESPPTPTEDLFIPELISRQHIPDKKKSKLQSKLQQETSSEDELADDDESEDEYEDDSFCKVDDNKSSSSRSFKTDDCEESESESIDESEYSDEDFIDDFNEDDYDTSEDEDDDDEPPYVPPKRSSSKRKIIQPKPFGYGKKKKKVSTKKQKTLQDCAPYACTAEKRAIDFLPSVADNSANNNHD